MIKVTTSGSFQNIQAFLGRMRQRQQFSVLYKYGPIGAAALSGATPVGDGQTAASWYYEIVDKPGYFAIHWLNSNVEEPGRIPIAAIIQYGHATGTGGYVRGVDYINPALRPIFDAMVADMWREVTK
jgi:hypothetical protein